MKKVTWKEVEDYIKILSIKIEEYEKTHNKRTGIFTFPRGGLMLADLLSYKTDLPILMHPTDNCVIIDDIIDTGITMKKYSDLKDEKDYFITAMFIHKDQLEEVAEYDCKCDYFEFIKDKEWIIYPWEEI